MLRRLMIAIATILYIVMLYSYGQSFFDKNEILMSYLAMTSVTASIMMYFNFEDHQRELGAKFISILMGVLWPITGIPIYLSSIRDE